MRHAEQVGVHLYPQVDGPARAGLEGVQRCGSVWECPSCASQILTARAEEVTGLIELARLEGYVPFLVTLTVRHQRDDDVRRLVVGLRDAWRRLTSGGKWMRFRQDFGECGIIRATEVTFGENGAHPHIHAVFLVPPGSSFGSVAELEGELFEWLAEYWPDAAARSLGELARPNEHGVDVLASVKGSGDYVTKLGLELSLATKEGRSGRPPLRVLGDWVERRDPADWALWRRYAVAFKGERRLTFPRKGRLRELLGIVRMLLELRALWTPRVEVLEIDGHTWDDLSILLPGSTENILYAAEFGGEERLRAWLAGALERVEVERARVLAGAGPPRRKSIELPGPRRPWELGADLPAHVQAALMRGPW